MAKKRRAANIFDSSKEELEQISQNIIRSTAKNTPNPASAPEEKPKPKSKPVAVVKTASVDAKIAAKPKEKKIEKEKLKVFWIGQEAHRLAKTAASMNGLTIRDYVEKLIKDDKP